MSKSDADTTRAIKNKRGFPSAKFSVTRGGLDIQWTDDGPEVDEVIGLTDRCRLRHGVADLARPPRARNSRTLRHFYFLSFATTPPPRGSRMMSSED